MEKEQLLLMQKRLGLILGLLLYIFDYASDIYVADQYRRNNVSWFGITVSIIVVSTVIGNITTVVRIYGLCESMPALVQPSFALRYVQAIRSPDKTNIYQLTRLRYFHTIIGSAPQLCLQLYIMVRQWYFPSYTLVSTTSSLLSLTWSITTLETERYDLNLLDSVVFLIWQLSTLVSRVTAIVVFTYAFRYYIFLAVAFHCFLATVAMQIIQIPWNDPEVREFHFAKSLVLSCEAGYASLFHTSLRFMPSGRRDIFVSTFFFVIESIACIILFFVAVEIPDDMVLLMPVATPCIIGGTFLSILHFLAYNELLDCSGRKFVIRKSLLFKPTVVTEECLECRGETTSF